VRGLIHRTYGNILPCTGAAFSDPGHKVPVAVGDAKSMQAGNASPKAACFRNIAMMKGKNKEAAQMGGAMGARPLL